MCIISKQCLKSMVLAVFWFANIEIVLFDLWFILITGAATSQDNLA